MLKMGRTPTRKTPDADEQVIARGAPVAGLFAA
jgi:hypothetical protein